MQAPPTILGYRLSVHAKAHRPPVDDKWRMNAADDTECLQPWLLSTKLAVSLSLPLCSAVPSLLCPTRAPPVKTRSSICPSRPHDTRVPTTPNVARQRFSGMWGLNTKLWMITNVCGTGDVFGFFTPLAFTPLAQPMRAMAGLYPMRRKSTQQRARRCAQDFTNRVTKHRHCYENGQCLGTEYMHVNIHAEGLDRHQ